MTEVSVSVTNVQYIIDNVDEESSIVSRVLVTMQVNGGRPLRASEYDLIEYVPTIVYVFNPSRPYEAELLPDSLLDMAGLDTPAVLSLLTEIAKRQLVALGFTVSSVKPRIVR